MQVEGIYTAEPRFEAKAKALKLKQEMAAAAEEGRKRLRGMPGLDLVETPKPLERQIRTEVEARGTAMPGLSSITLHQMIIPLPPLAEQKRIVAKLEEILPLCERLK